MFGAKGFFQTFGQSHANCGITFNLYAKLGWSGISGNSIFIYATLH